MEDGGRGEGLGESQDGMGGGADLGWIPKCLGWVKNSRGLLDRSMLVV